MKSASIRNPSDGVTPARRRFCQARESDPLPSWTPEHPRPTPLSAIPDPACSFRIRPTISSCPSSTACPRAGQDRYLLTNPQRRCGDVEKHRDLGGPEHEALSALWRALGESVRTAANVGFRAAPERSGHPRRAVRLNATTFARGRLFTDRALIKLSSVFRLPSDVRIGLVARYQDGQPFSRIVVATGLNQERSHPAFRTANRDSRSRKRSTADSEGFAIGKERFDVVFDVFNLLNTAGRSEEQTVSGATFRASLPSSRRALFHAGFRILLWARSPRAHAAR